MDVMRETHSSRDDHPVPDGLSVVFSAAPAPQHEEPAPAAAEPTGWPWFLPQDGLRHEDLVHAVDEDPRDVAESLARIPLVRRAVTLLEHIDPDMDEINRYWQAERDLGTLAAYGLLHREPLLDGQAVRYLGTVEVLVEAYGALEMFEELD